MRVHRVHDLADEAVGVVVHGFDGVTVPALLLGQLAREASGAEQMAEEVRRRVDPLDVDEEVVGPVLAPEAQADPSVGPRRCIGPLEVGEVVVEGERLRELLRRDVHERRELLARHVGGPLSIGGEPFLEVGRIGRLRRRWTVFHQEVIGEVIRNDVAADLLRRPGGPPADDGRRAIPVGKDVPEGFHLTHPTRHGELLARGVDGHEMPDAVPVGRLSRRDRRPDDGGEERLLGEQRPIGAPLPQLRKVGKLPLGEQEVDRRGIRAIETEDDDPSGSLRTPAPCCEQGGREDG